MAHFWAAKSTRGHKLAVVSVVFCVLATLLQSTSSGATSLGSTSWTVMDPRAGVAGQRYDWAATASTSNTLSSINATVPVGTSAPNRYLSLSGTTGDYVSTPDSVGNSPTTGGFTAPGGATIAATTSDISTANTAAGLGTDRWGVGFSASNGTLGGALAPGKYVGLSSTSQTVVSGASADLVLGWSLLAKVDYLQPAGVYTAGAALRLSPGL